MKLKTSDIKNIINMLNSPDKDNQILGLSLLNTVNFYTYRGELILLQKFCTVPNDDWKVHAPEAYEYIKALKIKYNSENRQSLNMSLINIDDLSLIFKMLKCNNKVRTLHEYLVNQHVRERMQRLIKISNDVKINIKIKIKNYE